jgi:hypothetical protein
MHANGTDLNGYVVDTTTAQIAAVGDLTGDGHARIVVADGAGLHVLALSHESLRREAFWANGERSSGWLLNTADNRIEGVGDLDGDGREEFVVKSPWGIGVIGMSGGGLHCQTLHANGSRLGDWILGPNDRIAGIGNLAGPGNRHEILIQAAK